MKKSSLRILLFLALNFVILFAVYQLFLKMESMLGTVLYLLAAAVLTVVYYVMNRGFGKPDIDPATLPSEWNPPKKSAYIEERRAAHERAKKILYWLFPLILVIGIDFIDLFLMDGIRDAFSALK